MCVSVCMSVYMSICVSGTFKILAFLYQRLILKKGLGVEIFCNSSSISLGKPNFLKCCPLHLKSVAIVILYFKEKVFETDA